MKINTDVTAISAHKQLNISADMDKPPDNTFHRQNRASEDASGLSMSEKMRSRIRALNSASSSAQDSISLMQCAENALNEYANILHRIRKLAIWGGDESASGGADFEDIQAESEALSEELNRIVELAQFNGKHLFNGEITQENHMDSSHGEVSLCGALLPDMTIQPQNYSITSAKQATAMLHKAEEDVSAISSMRLQLNESRRRLEIAVRNLDTISENLSSSETRIRDADMAKEMMSFTKSSILSNAAVAVPAQANQLPQNVLQLLR